MRRVAKWLGIGVAGLFGLLVLAVIAIFAVSGYILGRSHEARAETLMRPTAALLADAPRQARILGCVTCHGEGLKGQVMFDAPNVARVMAPNLTEIAARASDQQLAAAIRQGIGYDGRALFVMPSQQYSRLSDDEVAALIAFIRKQKRVPGNTEGASLGPLGRLGVATGKFRPTPAKIEEFRTRAPVHLGPALAAGRRLAANACSDCHGPALEGRELEDGSRAPDLTIAGAYDYKQFRTLLRAGTTPGNKKLGLMKKVAEKDFVHLTDTEIKSVHDYLRARAEKLSN
jgi:cytochrome c553